MAKIGMDSFLLDCRTNDNISEIEAEFGVKGFAVVVRLWQKIYSEQGYYCEWIERSPLLFLSNWFGGNSGVTVSLITNIVSRCLKNGIFDARMYEKYSILTSARIQKQYFDVVKRREEVLVKKEYLLVSVEKIKGIAYENGISVCRNEKNVCENSTSKGKGSKGNNKNTLCKTDGFAPLERDVLALFDQLWKPYPVKRGKARVSYRQKVKLFRIGYEEMERAINRYKKYVASIDYLHFQNGDTFFNGGYVDYLDVNYDLESGSEGKDSQKKNTFNDYPHREYDFNAIKKRMFEQ